MLRGYRAASNFNDLKVQDLIQGLDPFHTRSPVSTTTRVFLGQELAYL